MGHDGKPAHSWRVLLLPFLERDALHKRYSYNEPWDGPNNSKLALEMPELFAFSGEHVVGQSSATNFVAITGPETVWPPGRKMTKPDVKDLLSRTIQFAEYNGPPIHWMSPVDLSFSTMSFKVGDPAGIDSLYLDPAVAMVDMSLRRLSSEEISEDDLRALCTASGNDKAWLGKHFEDMEDARLREKKAAESN